MTNLPTVTAILVILALVPNLNGLDVNSCDGGVGESNFDLLKLIVTLGEDCLGK
jgi:hypothetical protein